MLAVFKVTKGLKLFSQNKENMDTHPKLCPNAIWMAINELFYPFSS